MPMPFESSESITAPTAAEPARRRLLAAPLAALVLFGAARPLSARSREAAPARPQPSPIEGVMLDVHDGDSFTFRTEDGRRLRIRVSGIDAPEKPQPYGEQSRRHLDDLLRGYRLRLDPVKQDVYARTVAKVWVLDGDQPPADAALSLIEAGLAWHFTRYRADQPAADVPRYAQAERTARTRSVGLWHDTAPEAPWDFRARARRKEAAPERRPRSEPLG